MERQQLIVQRANRDRLDTFPEASPNGGAKYCEVAKASTVAQVFALGPRDSHTVEEKTARALSTPNGGAS